MTDLRSGTPSNAEEARIYLVNEFKQDEERLLRKLDDMADDARVHEWTDDPENRTAFYDTRWLAISRTQFEQAFMALNRAVFQPQRIKLPEDDQT